MTDSVNADVRVLMSGMSDVLRGNNVLNCALWLGKAGYRMGDGVSRQMWADAAGAQRSDRDLQTKT
jgi:hypothetical protein